MKRSILLLVCLLALLLTGCMQTKVKENEKQFQIYYLNNAETKVDSYEFISSASLADKQLEELLEQLGTMPEKLEYKAPLAMNFQVLNYKFLDGKVVLNMDAAYKELPVTTEVLVRAALVRTLTQVEGIDYVAIMVEDVPLTDNLGNLVGMMSASQFIDNAGSEIGTYETVKLKLYFADETGSKLVEESRTKEYNSNIPMEKLVIEELISGPGNEEAFPVINPNTKIINVSVKDGICYVNLDETFLIQIHNVSSEVTIYAIVNSLVELNNVNRVQISINGVEDIMYRETFHLTTVFERNLDLVEK